MDSGKRTTFRYFSREREAEFLRCGYKKRHFFPHSTFYLPKCGPDGFQLTQRMCGPCDLSQVWEVVLYGDELVIKEFPKNLFFDSDIIWHQQQFGRNGQIATANLVVAGDRLYSTTHISDVVQRISRQRQHKTRIENKFEGWTHMLLNSVLNFARERNLHQVLSATSKLARCHTDPARHVESEMFERIYDRTLQQLYNSHEDSGWWVINLSDNRDRLVVPERKSEYVSDEKTICIGHDIERGAGHRSIDGSFAAFADKTSPGNLESMLRIEDDRGIKTTYNVLGSFLSEVRGRIENSGHSIGFHSFDHRLKEPPAFLKWGRRLLGRPGNTHGYQLGKCREVDYRIKGYRPPQSRITKELSDENLCFHNFEWLASSSGSLGITAPELRNCLVRIPIVMDDFDLHLKIPYELWESRVIAEIERNNFAAISLHDCYGHLWLPHYEKFLEKINKLGRLRTFDDVSNEMILTSSV